MISWVIESAIQSKTVDEVWVSTEDKEIKEVALSCGALVHDRDPELSTDKIFKMEAIRELLRTHYKYDRRKRYCNQSSGKFS